MLAEIDAQQKAMLAKGPLADLHELTERLSFYGTDTLVIEKKDTQKIYYSAEKLCTDVRALATALLSMGLGGSRIAILSENSYRFIVCFLAVAGGVGTAVPLDKELSDSDLDELLAKSGAKALFCSSTFFDTALRNKNSNAALNYICAMDEECAADFCSWDSLLMQGKKLLDSGDKRFEALSVSPDDVAAMIFSSGTTGPNKGVLLTHANFVSNINTIASAVRTLESTISVLPMNHIYELNCNILPMLYTHTVICINDRMRNLMRNFRFFKPKMAVVVPLFLESFYNNIRQKLRKDGIDKKTDRLIAVSNRLLDGGIDIRRTLFKDIHAYFGDELRLLICGGAPVDQKYVKGLTELGFDIYVGYGLTEASPIAALNTDTRHHPESVGKAFPNTDIHIHAPNEDGEGEVWLRGDNITPGYADDPAATLDSFEDGWFKTGDIGKMTADGYLILTGRKKNLIILDNGKNVHPEEIETVIRACIPYVREAVVMETEKEIFGMHQKIIAAVLYVDPEDFPTLTSSELEQKAKDDMAAVNAKLPGYKSVSHVLVARDSFQKTSTNKILRQKVIEQYGNEKINGGEDDA